jgi:aldose 1-epimerase
MPNAQGAFTDVVLGYDTLPEYEENDAYIGAAIGRIANRIGNSVFTLNGKTYNLARNAGVNHLHGGMRGFDKVIWKSAAQGNMICFTRISPDGEENYPGKLEVIITYVLTDGNELKIIYDAVTDADTIINLTNHSYFNLNGKGTALGHYLQIFADTLTENDQNSMPTGKLLQAAGTPFDFREPKQIGRDIDADDIQLRYGSGYDINFVLPDSSDASQLRKAAVLFSPETGISMTTLTTLPGVQLYTGNHLTPRKGKNGALINRHSGVCLETQVWPNAMAYPHFPSPILRAGEQYHTETIYRFDIQS